MTIHTTMESPVGELLLVGQESDRGVALTSVTMAGQRYAPAMRAGWRRDPAAFAEVTRQLAAYFAGELTTFSLELAPRGTEFQQRVWRALDTVPYGTTTTYGRLAAQLGLPRDRIQALGAAIGARPAGDHPPVSPGHRLGRRHAGLRRRRGTQAAAARPRGRPPGGLVVTTPGWQAADWQAIAAELDAQGCARTPRLLTPAECRDLAALYDKPELFRSTIDMARHRFGSGQYRYFTHDLPEPVRELREALYPRLLVIARDWAGRLGRPAPWPDTLGEWVEMCHRAGQGKSAQILLSYRRGDWNALHRDVFGDLVFPLQVVVGLDEYGTDYTGGEFLLVEQRPRAQSRGTCVALEQGHGLIFTTRDRPVRSARGWSAGPVRHGVSTVRSGHRHALGLVFHDA